MTEQPRAGEGVGEEEGADRWTWLSAAQGKEARQRLPFADWAGPARSEEGGGGEGARAGRLSGRRQQATGPLGPEEGSGKEKKFSFSNLTYQIPFSNVFEHLLNFDSNQSSQKYLCNNMHA
jgi:hypothetical protein